MARVRRVNNKFSLTKAEQTMTAGVDEMFGDGSDGSLTISSGQTIYLSSDMYYQDLTIQSGATLFTNGFRILVNGTLTNNGTIGMPNNILETANASTVSRRSDVVKSYAWGEGSANEALSENIVKDLDVAVNGFLVSADGNIHAVSGGQPGDQQVGDLEDPGEGQPGQPGNPGAFISLPPGSPGGPGNPGNPGQDGNAAARGSGGQRGSGGGVVLIVAKTIDGSGIIESRGTSSTSESSPSQGLDGVDGNPGNPAPNIDSFANLGSPYDSGVNQGYHHVSAGNHPHGSGTGSIFAATGGKLSHNATTSGGTFNPSTHNHGNLYDISDLYDIRNANPFPTDATFFNQGINEGEHPHPAVSIAPTNYPAFSGLPANQRPNVSNHNAIYDPQGHNPGYHDHPAGVNSSYPFLGSEISHAHNSTGTNANIHLPSTVAAPSNAGNMYHHHTPGTIPGTPFHQQLTHPHAGDGSWPSHTTFDDAHAPVFPANQHHTPSVNLPTGHNGHTATVHNQHGHGYHPGNHPHSAGTLPGNPSNATHPAGHYHIAGTEFHTKSEHPHNAGNHANVGPSIPSPAISLGHGTYNSTNDNPVGHTGNVTPWHSSGYNSHNYGSHNTHSRSHTTYYSTKPHHLQILPSNSPIWPTNNHNHSGSHQNHYTGPLTGIQTYWHRVNPGSGNGPAVSGNSNHNSAPHANPALGVPANQVYNGNAYTFLSFNAGDHINHNPGHNPNHTHPHTSGHYNSPNLPANNPHQHTNTYSHNAGNHDYNHNHNNYNGHPSSAPFYPRSTHNHSAHYNEGWNSGEWVHHTPGHNPDVNHGQNSNLPTNYSGHSGNKEYLHNAGYYPHGDINGLNIHGAPTAANIAGHTPVTHTGTANGHTGDYHSGSWPEGNHDHTAGPISPLNDPTTPTVRYLYTTDFNDENHTGTRHLRGHTPGSHVGAAGIYHFVGTNDGVNFAAHALVPGVPLIGRRFVQSTGGSQNPTTFTAGYHHHPSYNVHHATGGALPSGPHHGNPYNAGHNESYDNLEYLGGTGGAGGAGGAGGTADPSTYDPGYQGGVLIVSRDSGNVQNQIGHSNFSKILDA